MVKKMYFKYGLVCCLVHKKKKSKLFNKIYSSVSRDRSHEKYLA